VSSAAVMIPRRHLPCCSMEPARDVADNDEEHAVSMLTDGPTDSGLSGDLLCGTICLCVFKSVCSRGLVCIIDMIY
jgi:hypothetical protein